MTEPPSDPFGLDEMLSLLGLPNPLAGVGRSVDQFRHGVDELLTTIARFNETLDQINGVARRVNGLLDEIEEPLKAAMPQVTRTVRAADAITQQLGAPVEKLVPGLSRLADVLANPSITRVPSDLATVVDSLGDLVRRLQPLTQMAESAGSMLGLRSLGGLIGRTTAPTVTAPPTPAPAPPTTPEKTPAKKAAAKKTTAKKTTAKKPAAKKSPPPQAG
jgi:hypothetical protein